MRDLIDVQIRAIRTYMLDYGDSRDRFVLRRQTVQKTLLTLHAAIMFNWTAITTR